MPDRPRPTDLQPEEEAVANWLGRLPRVEAPASLRQRVLSGTAGATPVHRGWFRWASGAAAAMVLATVGWIGLQSIEQDPGGSPAEGTRILVEDEGLGMHALETFDQVGFERHSELIADWGN